MKERRVAQTERARFEDGLAKKKALAGSRRSLSDRGARAFGDASLPAGASFSARLMSGFLNSSDQLLKRRDRRSRAVLLAYLI